MFDTSVLVWALTYKTENLHLCSCYLFNVTLVTKLTNVTKFMVTLDNTMVNDFGFKTRIVGDDVGALNGADYRCV